MSSSWKFICRNITFLVLGVIVPVIIPYLIEDTYSTKTSRKIFFFTLSIAMATGLVVGIYNFRLTKEKTAPYFVLLSISIVLYFGLMLLVSWSFQDFGF